LNNTKAAAIHTKILSEVESKKLLQQAGLPVVPNRFCKSTEEAVLYSKELTFPVVVKIVAKDVVHKSDIGGVVLNIQTPEEVGNACNNILKALKHEELEGFLVEEMATTGLEFIIGSFKDESYGDVIMFGLGGVFTEVLKKFTLRAIPISEHDAKCMIASLKIEQLLQGYRHLPKVDKEKLVQVLLQFGGKDGFLTKHASKIKEVDINPLIYNHDGVVIVDASMVVYQIENELSL